MAGLSEREQAFWDDYVRSLPEARVPHRPRVEAAHAGGRDITDGLLALYLRGTKTAGSGLVEDYVAEGDPLPAVGDFWIHLDSRDEPRLVLRTARVVTHRFLDVPEEIAIAEGEGDLSLAHWRDVHASRYAPHLARWGLASIEEATVVTEFFEIVHGRPGSEPSLG